MGNKGSKPGGSGSKSMRPPVKSDNRGFKFGNLNNAGRDAGKSAPAAPSTAYGAVPPSQGQHGGAPPPAPSDDHDSDGEDDSGPAEQIAVQDINGPDRPMTKVTVEDFDLLKVLGKGSFGKVMMVRKKDTKKIYAMKTLRKAALIKRNQNMQRMYDKILNAPLRFPSFMSAEAKDLLTGLLTRKVGDRLGSGPTDAEEIKAHPFFKGIDWEAVMNKEIVPEFKPPNRLGSMDTSNFDIEFTGEKPVDSVVTTTMSETQRSKAQFPGFTYNEETMDEDQKGH
ncbi:hypothetical protein PybrP1_006830 [[Pythium] brassicae (nom. inval.)]|nr:hypothetical protein PybrP1_006830 [[Pythium] brassicae (nom. inval.)]